VTSFVTGKQVVAPKPGFYRPTDVKAPPGVNRWMVFCVDAKSGKILWEKVAFEGTADQPIHVKNSYAPETAVVDGERVYARFGGVGVFCYDMDGKEVWAKRLPSHRTRLGWGTGSSPVLHADRLYVLDDNEQESYLLALDKRTGKEIWRSSRDEKSSWSTPFVWENSKRTEIVTIATKRVRSYDLDGKLLWEFGGMSSICIPMPVVAGDLLIIDSGYEFGKPRPLVAVRPGASGDISLEKGQTSNEFIAWWVEGAGSYHASPLVYQGQIYVLYSQGMLASYDAQTGREIYGKKRLGGTVTSSPWAADGKIFCLNEDGDTFVVRAGPQYERLQQKNSLGEMCMATPAIADGSLFIRTMTKLYCIRK
jgi:outer membrane protein assembly factor BamB